MLKKLLKFCKWLMVGIIWTYVFLYASLFFTSTIWNFNYLSLIDWEIISAYWNQGGSIKEATDYGLFLTLILLIPLWILGWRYFYHRDFISILLAPINWYNQKQIKKYGQNASRIVIKNMGSTGKKINPEEMIEAKLKDFKTNIEQQEKNSDILREKLKEKFDKKN